ncbi:C39 family peptidase [Halobacillus sp. SY10]|uniref:C39 family peptidase n=1 Tax=Halobacillus sp. SY10 TaxID=3381356 RepID=UPI0038796D40
MCDRKPNFLDFPTVMQEPELPNGCEITSITSILNYEGIDVTKGKMSDDYLIKKPLSYKEGKRFGADPDKAYGGNPRSENSGWYVFEDPIVDAANQLIASTDKNLTAKKVSGSSKEEILNYIETGTPVMVWTTLDLSTPVKSGGWYVYGTEEFHSSYTNLHAMVLTGWENGKIHVMNPLKGKVVYDEEKLFKSYKEMGSRAVIIQKS